MKLNKKIGMLALIFALIGFFLFYFIFFLEGWKTGMTGFASTGLAFLDNGMVISNETCEKLSRVIVIHKAGCIECNKVMPILKEIEKKNNLNFTYYDILIPEDKEELFSELRLIPRKAPTVIVDCNVYVGPRSELEYKNYILG